MNREDLKKCPFCGGEAEIRDIGSDGAVVRCRVCGSGTSVVQAHPVSVARVLARDVWNKRAGGGR